MASKTAKLTIVTISILFLVLLSACSSEKQSTEKTQTEKAANTIRIGYQKFGTLNFLKAQGTLEKELKSLGVKVEWTEFPGGPQLLEALNVGSLDFGHTGEAPPIFAQAAGAPLVYFANEPENPKGEALVVPKDSPIKSIKDLKGKKIALNKGSNVHYLLVKALEKNGLKYEDVETAFLPPSDARAAFEKGVVDAWVIWDPFLAEAERKIGARILFDGTDLVKNREFFLATVSFANENQEVLEVLYEEIAKAEQWVEGNKKEAAEFLAPQIGMEKETLDVVLSRRSYGIQNITEREILDQQLIANKFFELKLIPKKIDTSEAKIQSKE
ncbi:sulfonate ABC transporter substrate-binding protein [Bacillus marasmi]|uniref:sulfonate ABC transporter substrate-binding protein n=1 Tax=Bacillus marasmi TaxID=1926279 RepID=UPI0011C95CF7|nr:sulfonate ABC transporter substrate-binding protein [Bacillus marasmi]